MYKAFTSFFTILSQNRIISLIMSVVLNTNLEPLSNGVKISQIQTSKAMLVDEKKVSV